MNVQAAFLFTLPMALAGVFWLTYPFSDELVTKTIPTGELSKAQRSNIALALRKIDGTVLRPGEEFSFNRIVGPRTDGRGYRPAPSYLGSENPATIGGGICLASSALYQAALESGLKVTERVAHSKTIRTVAPGLDAAVWYGQADLKFKNTFKAPIRISAACDRQTMRVSISGQANLKREITLKRVVVRRTQSQVVVDLVRKQDNQELLVSRDLYKVSP